MTALSDAYDNMSNCNDCQELHYGVVGTEWVEELLCTRHLKEYKKQKDTKEMAYRKKHGLL